MPARKFAAKKASAPKPEKPESLEPWIRDAACSIRGAKDVPKSKDFIPDAGIQRIADTLIGLWKEEEKLSFRAAA